MSEKQKFTPLETRGLKTDAALPSLAQKLEQQSERNEGLDQYWFEQYKELGTIDDISYLNGNRYHRDQQKADFLAGKTENPDLDYPRIDTVKLASMEGRLLELKKQVRNQEISEFIRQAYLWSINEKIAVLEMLRATAHDDMRRFDRWARFIYGRSSPEIFSFMIQQSHEQIEQISQMDNPEARQAAQEFKNVLPSNTSPVKVFKLPAQQDIATLKQFTETKMADIVALTEGMTGELGREEIKQAFDQAFRAIKAKGWKTVIDQGGRITMAVDEEDKTVYIPTAIPVSKPAAEMSKLLIHEIGTHVRRSVKGERSRLLLLSLGLDRYIKGEEGVTVAMEKSLDGQMVSYGDFAASLAIGLAQGLDGIKRDFRQVFEIVKRQQIMEGLAQGKMKKEAEEKGIERAYTICVRIFRGTNAKTPGVCFPRDMVYYEGQLGVWQVVRENPPEMRRFLVGHYDPQNKRHIWLMDQAGIEDEDLDELRK